MSGSPPPVAVVVITVVPIPAVRVVVGWEIIKVEAVSAGRAFVKVGSAVVLRVQLRTAHKRRVAAILIEVSDGVRSRRQITVGSVAVVKRLIRVVVKGNVAVVVILSLDGSACGQNRKHGNRRCQVECVSHRMSPLLCRGIRLRSLVETELSSRLPR